MIVYYYWNWSSYSTEICLFNWVTGSEELKMCRKRLLTVRLDGGLQVLGRGKLYFFRLGIINKRLCLFYILYILKSQC